MITILVFSYNRHSFLIRQIKYWSNYSDFKLLIMDGSPVPLDLSSLANTPDNLTYIHNPCSVLKRIQLGLEQVTTPYVILHGDDEFYLPSALKKCALFLEKDPTYSVVSGICLGFNYYDKIVVGCEEYQNWNHHLCHSNGFNRLIKHFSRYSPDTIYGLWRISELKIAVTYASRLSWSCSYVGELVVEAYGCLAGKTKIIPCLQWLRSYENPPIEYDINRSLTYEKWAKRYKNELKIYLETLSNMMTQTNSVAPNLSAYDQAKRVHEAYLKFSHKKNGGFYRKFYLSVKSWVLLLLPQKTLNIVKNQIYFYTKTIIEKTLRRHKSLLQTAIQVEKFNIHVDYEELNKVEQVIVDFYHQR